MIRSVLQSAYWVVREPRIFLLSAAATTASELALSALGFPGRMWSLPANALSAVIVLLLARSWVGLSIARTALAVLRRDRRGPLLAPVSLVAAFSVLVVSLVPAGPIVVGAYLMLASHVLLSAIGSLLALAGLLWVAAWSQAGMLILDGRADLMESGGDSAFLTRGRRGEILGLWLVVGTAVALLTWLDAGITGWLAATGPGAAIAAILHLALRVLVDAFSTCCIASLCFELDRDGNTASLAG